MSKCNKQENGIVYVGVHDENIDLFESMYTVPEGISYNSYVILDDDTAVLDTVDAQFTSLWLKNVEKALHGKQPKYLIVQHMEPDHSASISAFLRVYPNAWVVASKKAFVMMKNYFHDSVVAHEKAVSDGETLVLGKHKLTFIAAPMVHWPEVMMTYEEHTKTLFSADAFGKFGLATDDGEWACEARRYYFGIVGKYGAQVQKVLQKLKQYPIESICPLHGPILRERAADSMRLYDIWSSYQAESDGVVIAYTSVYGNTRKAVELLAKQLIERGVKTIVYDLARSDVSEAVEDAFRYGTLVLATTTYNGGVFPFMRAFIGDLVERNFQNRMVALIENGSWSPMATSVMKSMLSGCKNLRYAQTEIKILSAVSKENEQQICGLAQELCQ